MKIKYENFKKGILANKETIVRLFNECEERRAKVEIINDHLNTIKDNILKEVDYLVAEEHKEYVGFDVVKHHDYVVFITNENGLSDQFCQKLYDAIMSDRMLNDYFDLSEMKPSFICGLMAHIDYREDFELMNLLRSLKGDRLKTVPFNIDIHIAEYEVIRGMIKTILLW